MRAKALALTATLLAVPLAGCATQSPAPEGQVPFETLEQGDQSGIQDRRTVVVSNQSALEDLWTEHTSNQGGDPGIPNVDFDRRVVVGIFQGQSPNGCYGAEVTNVTGEGDHIRVEGVFYHVEGVACTEQITYPFHVVTIPRYDARVEFDVTEETRYAGNQTNGTR